MDPVERIVALLGSDSPRNRIAAAVVLGELGARSPQVVSALAEMARDELAALAEPAVEALGKLGARGAMPVLLAALERKDLAQAATQALAALGGAEPKAFAALLEGLRGQSWESAGKLALSVRQTARSAPPAERKSMAKQAAAFLKKLRDDEPALRGAIKILGYLELHQTAALIEPFLSPRQSAVVRVEAITALRFALGPKPAARSLRALIKLLEEPDALVARAARDTLTVVPGVTPAELLRLAHQEGELSQWALERLHAAGAAKELAQLAGDANRVRAQAAVRALAGLRDSAPLLVGALIDAAEETAAHAIAEALERVQLAGRDLAKLRAAGAATLKKSFALARRQLEPVRRADPQGWAQLLRDAVKKASDPARAEAISDLLARSSWATPQDRYAHASLLLRRSGLDPHPRARHADPALVELEKLAADGFAVAAAVAKDKQVSDEARYHAGFHFAEHASPEVRAQGVALLEELASRGRGKIARAAKNKLGLLRG
jgi:hypothetical protein